MIVVAPNRYNNRGLTTKIGVVVHTAEGPESAGGYTSLMYLFTVPGTTPVGDHMIGAAYHAVANPDGWFTEILPGSAAPYSAPPWNESAWHIVMPGRASQSRAEWLGDISRQYIKGVARFIADRCALDSIPLHRLTVDEMKAAGTRPTTGLGYCGHVDVSLAYRKSTHTDPGPNFPWDVLAQDIVGLVAPPPIEEDDMPKPVITYWKPPKPGEPLGPTGYIYTNWSCWYSVTPDEQADLIRRGAIDETHGPGLSTTRSLFRAKAA